MAETIAGMHLALGPILSGCYSIVKGINQLRQSYNFMPLTLMSIVLTCNTTSSTLSQVDFTLTEYSGIAKDQFYEQFDGLKIACTIILSLLEKHVSDLLDTAASEMPLKAQKTSRKDKLKALYNEYEMERLFAQLKDHNALLNTMLNQLLSHNQNRMIDMMTNQEKTLESMLEAQASLRRFLQHGPVDKETDTASILSSTTSGTALTAFDFDSIIKSTAVYKHCMNRRGVETNLLESLERSTIQYNPLQATNGAVTEGEEISSSMQSQHKTRTETEVISRKDHVPPASRSSSPTQVFASHTRPSNNEAPAKASAVPSDSSDSNTTSSTNASDHVKKVVDAQSPPCEIIYTPSSKHEPEACLHRSLEAQRHATPHTDPTLLDDLFSGNRVISTSHEDLGQTTEDSTFETKEEVISVAVSCNYLLAAATRTEILIWNISTGDELAKINAGFNA
ncbi:hypothetical protein KCU81_g7952, partial [Aureobasidium melanogenum]|uniref:Uncharacterized protein n=1 Tax=Aureobasidium melanogenum (strain CBS 110374) TaxID=1043003 RepID=A0A074VVJ2_AURM1